MPTPPKPYAVLQGEGKSHRTKAELDQRKRGEAALLTGTPMQEWPATKANSEAHRQFLRLRKLLKSIQKDDALHEASINRYCIMSAECADLEADRARIVARQRIIDEWLDHREMEAAEHAQESQKLIEQKLGLERALSSKRKMLLDLEKENVMTIASGLRSIPKKPEEPEETAMDKLMMDRMRRRVQ